jgi:TPR repeat protein
MDAMKFRALLCATLLFTGVAVAGNDIWVSLFRETLQQARQGDSEAQYNVGAMYQNGRGVEADRERALEWYHKAAEQGNSRAMARLGLMESNRDSFHSELEQAKLGNTESQYNVGNMYARGNGTNIDLRQAVGWYEKAAGQGHIKAAYKLGLAYYEGAGVRRSGKHARKWFGVAAADGYAPAQYYLGRIHAEGQGVRKDYGKALEWFSRAIDGGFDQARAELIDVTERMKLQSRTRKPATGSTARQDRTTGKHAAVTAATAMENLMLGNWNRGEQPVAWLPSSINNCRTEQERIVCFSDDQVRDSGTNTIKYKTKAIISGFSDAGAFHVTYRNLVISAVAKEPAVSESVSAFDEAAAEHGYTVKTGWGKQHVLACRLDGAHTVNCTKDGTHALVLTSQQQVAGRR